MVLEVQVARRFELLRSERGVVIHRETIDYYTPLASEVLPDFKRSIADILQD